MRYQASTTNARPSYRFPASTAAVTAFGLPEGSTAGMYVPMARSPFAFATLVATRSMSPRAFMRWKSVTFAPVRRETSSTSGSRIAKSFVCGIGVAPSASLGSFTSTVDLSSWLTAVHVTASAVAWTPPPRTSASFATRRAEPTARDTSACVVSQTRRRSRTVRSTPPRASASTSSSTWAPMRQRAATRMPANATASATAGTMETTRMR
ncbi:MAG: hypothetical protein QM704_18810 [Anaeromyxobacteraceae bacterium]